MKYLALFIILISICINHYSRPKYAEGTCFENEFSGVKIIKVTNQYYEIITYMHFLLLQKDKIKHKEFEQRIDDQNLKVTSCDQIKQEQ